MLQQAGSVSVEELRTKPRRLGSDDPPRSRILENADCFVALMVGAEPIEPLFTSLSVTIVRFRHRCPGLRQKSDASASGGRPDQAWRNDCPHARTTTTEVIRGIPHNHNITVVTNTVNIAMELSKRKDISVFVTGGYLRGDWFSLIGPTAMHALDQLVVNVFVYRRRRIDAAWGANLL